MRKFIVYIERIKFSGLILMISLKSSLSFSQDSIRIMYYNILNFPGNTSFRVYNLRTILLHTKPDVLVVTELQSDEGANLILQEAIHNSNLGPTYQKADFTNGPDSDNMIFYNNEKLVFRKQDTIETELRLINHYKLFVNDPDLFNTNDTLFLDFFIAHLRSGSSSTQERYNECLKMMNYIDADTSLKNIFVGGDFNFYTYLEPAYELLTNGGIVKLMDPISKPGDWSDNSLFAPYHTQSPRNRAFNGGSVGGLDDRFDFIFVNDNVINGTKRIKYLSDTYQAFGNDGQHFNDSITAPPSNPLIPDSVIQALHTMSDHLPVIMDVWVDLQRPDSNLVNVKCKELIISEYIEGSSFNKAIELYNLSNSDTIDLSNYKIGIYANGSQVPTQQIQLSGIIPATGFYILANNNSTLSNIIAYADTLTSKLNYNGNDAVALLKNDTVIDVIGEIGNDPGVGWTVGSGSTKDFTLIRHPRVKKPVQDWQTSLPDWIVKSLDDDSDIHNHLNSCNGCFLKANVSTFPCRCGSATNGTIQLDSIEGAYPPYTFLWSNGDTTKDIYNLLPGRYYFTMTDVIGCEIMDYSDVISIPEPIASAINITSAGCPSDCNGSAEIFVLNESNYQTPFSYLWSDPFAQSDSMAIGLCTGTYFFTFTDYFNCMDTGTVTIPGEVNPTADFSFSINQNNVSFLNASTNASDYVWDFGDGASSTEINPLHLYGSAGNYTVLLTASNGCGTVKMSKNISIFFTGMTEEVRPEIYFSIHNGSMQMNLPKELINHGALLSVYDLAGKKIYETQLNTTPVDVFSDKYNLAQGTYLVEINTKNKVSVVKKIVVLDRNKL
ncbi:MAG: hypothetical protein A3H98_00275 [Bacteroidetes bacterium RIFCSPLOWO2_02_FULL_36_8]|nr:MAG: hypothetical protein A3H98_00275 [Bacteroidetes bacterium RIFCSPLOWO2_02_FULL_36_8]OFY70831.1 MAG: hypothetical protein A3G23_11960 [Bacteroidetes bacterium RIFCSPLOWO2_12_FULL_37_12]